MKPRNRRLSAGATFVLDVDPKCPCGNVATNMLELHAMHQCMPSASTVDSLRCEPCLERDLERIEEIVQDEETCRSCGLTIVSLSDMIVRLCPL